VWNPSQARLQSDLTVNELVVEADVCRLGPRVGVVDAPQPRPIDCAEAHRAGLAARVDVAVRQVERAQQRAGTANGHNLGMRGRVVVGRDLVPAFRDDCVVADDDCAEWSAAVRASATARSINACSLISQSPRQMGCTRRLIGDGRRIIGDFHPRRLVLLGCPPS